MNPPDLIVAGGVLLSFLSLYLAMRFARRKRLLENLPTSKTQGVFIGLVELKGTAEVEEPLTSNLAARRCVYFSWSVEEHWSRTVTETYTDSKGRSRTRTRRESGWKTVADGGDEIPFYLQDDTGVIQVVPDRAKVEPVTVFSETCGRSDPLYYAKGPPGAVSHSDHRRRFVEKAIPLHAPLYVVGKARERQDIVAPEVAYDADAPVFLISTGTEEKVTSKLGWVVVAWTVLALLLWTGGLIGRDAALELDPAVRWPQWILFAAIYVPVWILGWMWMVYNSFVRLRRRVDHAWSLIDIQLKRRHDVVRQVVDVVKGLRDYERKVQTEVAQLRGQAEAEPRIAGAELRGCVGVSRVIVERYPELRAHESFLRLQKLLVETEQRIALAREYFNEITTYYNVRLEQIPDRWIAKTSRLKPRALWEAGDFERAPVEVSLAS
jgi:hypothetical protein